MKKWWLGFTMIEVTLFLAITGLLFMGITIGTQTSINQQRSYDSVQSFAEFLRGVYSGVSNPQSTEGGNKDEEGGGRSKKALYGKLITFGESKDLSGGNNTQGKVFAYDVIGNIDPASKYSGTNVNSTSIYAALDLNVVYKNTKTGAIVLAGVPESYTPRWQSKIETTNINTRVDYKGAILIVKHPRSGTITTLEYHSSNYGNTIEINQMANNETAIQNQLKTLLQNNEFKVNQVDFCINSFDDDNFNKRTDIRLVDGAHNASGVEIIDLDSEENSCRKKMTSV